MIVPVVLGAVFGAVAAVAARSRGRNSIGWFLAGMVIGPFALVVALLPPVPRRGRLVACPRCAEVVSSEAEVCRYCGEPLPASRQDDLPPPRRPLWPEDDRPPARSRASSWRASTR